MHDKVQRQLTHCDRVKLLLINCVNVAAYLICPDYVTGQFVSRITNEFNMQMTIKQCRRLHWSVLCSRTTGMVQSVTMKQAHTFSLTVAHHNSSAAQLENTYQLGALIRKMTTQVVKNHAT